MGPPFDKNIFCSYKKSMQYEWDENKRLVNLEKHGLDFTDCIRFEWGDAVILPDERKDYGESRFVAYGFCCGHFVALAFTPRGGTVRIISFRKANSRERGKYASE